MGEHTRSSSLHFVGQRRTGRTVLVSRSRLLVARVWPWVLGAVILLPVLRPGFVLSYDMVFVPDLGFRSDFLGLGRVCPAPCRRTPWSRSSTRWSPATCCRRRVLLAALVLGGLGARRLVPSDDLVAQLAGDAPPTSGTRSLPNGSGSGHWPLLLGLRLAAVALRRGAAGPVRRGHHARDLALVGSRRAQCGRWGGRRGLRPRLRRGTGSGGVDPVGARAARRTGRQRPRSWPARCTGGGALSDPLGVEAFAARAEGWLPLPLTLLGLGGIWNAEVVPASREGGGPRSRRCLLTVSVSAVGIRHWRPAVAPRGERQALVAAAVVGADGRPGREHRPPAAGLAGPRIRPRRWPAPRRHPLPGPPRAADRVPRRPTACGVLVDQGAPGAGGSGRAAPSCRAAPGWHCCPTWPWAAGTAPPGLLPGAYAGGRRQLQDRDGDVLVLPCSGYPAPALERRAPGARPARPLHGARLRGERHLVSPGNRSGRTRGSAVAALGSPSRRPGSGPAAWPASGRCAGQGPEAHPAPRRTAIPGGLSWMVRTGGHHGPRRRRGPDDVRARGRLAVAAGWAGLPGGPGRWHSSAPFGASGWGPASRHRRVAHPGRPGPPVTGG